MPDAAPRTLPDIERRVFYFTEVRTAPQQDGPPRLTGHAAIFNSLSEDLGGFREVIRPGAFTDTIKNNPDIYALLEHDSMYPLARTGNGRLFLHEDRRGLAVTITPTDTTYARDLMLNVKEDLINKMSFAFSLDKQDQNWTEENGTSLREIKRVTILYEVSPVTFPAYGATDIHARSALKAAGLEFEPLGDVFFKARNHVALTVGERDLVKRSIQILTTYLTPEPPRSGPSVRSASSQPRVAALRERLEKARRI